MEPPRMALEGRVESVDITDEIEQLIAASGIPYVKMKAPIAVRTYPPEVYNTIRIQDFLRPDVYTEEYAARTNRWLADRPAVVAFLKDWDRRFTFFFCYASERIDFETGDPDRVLDEMAEWVFMPKIHLRFHRFEKTDEDWDFEARAYLNRRVGHDR